MKPRSNPVRVIPWSQQPHRNRLGQKILWKDPRDTLIMLAVGESQSQLSLLSGFFGPIRHCIRARSFFHEICPSDEHAKGETA